MEQERISLSREELKRYTVIKQVMDKKLTTKEAAQLLGLSTRQVFRLKKKVIQEGETGVIHKNRGRKPAHAIPDHVKAAILELFKSERYKNFNDIHFAELLAKHEGIEVKSFHSSQNSP